MADQDYSAEEWRDIPGYEGWYQASSEGRIKSLARSTPTRNRWGPCTYTKPEQIIEGRLIGGYRRMKLCVAGMTTDQFAHKLVAIAFHGMAPDGCDQVAHWDGDKENNQPTNLRWTDTAGNAADKVRHGSTANQFGERHSQSKLTNEQIAQIRAVPHYHGVNRDLGAQYGVVPQTIGKIRRGERWPHL